MIAYYIWDAKSPMILSQFFARMTPLATRMPREPRDMARDIFSSYNSCPTQQFCPVFCLCDSLCCQSIRNRCRRTYAQVGCTDVKGYRTKSLIRYLKSFVAYFGRCYPVADLRLCCRGCFHYRYECSSYCPNAYCIHYEETI